MQRINAVGPQLGRELAPDRGRDFYYVQAEERQARVEVDPGRPSDDVEQERVVDQSFLCQRILPDHSGHLLTHPLFVEPIECGDRSLGQRLEPLLQVRNSLRFSASQGPLRPPFF